jgi:hypothetical protein
MPRIYKFTDKMPYHRCREIYKKYDAAGKKARKIKRQELRKQISALIDHDEVTIESLAKEYDIPLDEARHWAIYNPDFDKFPILKTTHEIEINALETADKIRHRARLDRLNEKARERYAATAHERTSKRRKAQYQTESDFRAKLVIDTLHGCVMWTGMCTPDGYGILNWQGKSILAHRVNTILSGVNLTDKILIKNTLCPSQSRRCVTPVHWTVTARIYAAAGPRKRKVNPILQLEKALDMLTAWDTGKYTEDQITELFNISPLIFRSMLAQRDLYPQTRISEPVTETTILTTHEPPDPNNIGPALSRLRGIAQPAELPKLLTPKI